MNPDAYRKYKAEQEKVELPDEVKDDIEKQMSNPLRHSDSEILKYFEYLLDHPEESRFYKEQQFKLNSEMPCDDQPSVGWKIEIPIISMDF